MAITENNSVMYNYIQSKKSEKDIFFDNTSLYIGSIILIIVDYFISKESFFRYMLKFIYDNFVDNFMIVILPMSLLFVIFLLPFLLIYDYYKEIGKISIGYDFKNTFFKEEKELQLTANDDIELTTKFNKDIPF